MPCTRMGITLFSILASDGYFSTDQVLERIQRAQYALSLSYQHRMRRSRPQRLSRNER